MLVSLVLHPDTTRRGKTFTLNPKHNNPKKVIDLPPPQLPHWVGPHSTASKHEGALTFRRDFIANDSANQLTEATESRVAPSYSAFSTTIKLK